MCFSPNYKIQTTVSRVVENCNIVTSVSVKDKATRPQKVCKLAINQMLPKFQNLAQNFILLYIILGF